jgi:hypothetical protein
MTKTFLKWFFGLYLFAIMVPSLFFFFEVLSTTGMVAAAFAALFWGMTAMTIILFYPAITVFVIGLLVCAASAE